MANNESQTKQNKDFDKDDIDLRKFWNIALRNKFFISSITALATTLGIIYSLIK